MANARSTVLWSAFLSLAAGFYVTAAKQDSIPLPAQTSNAFPDYQIGSLYVAPDVPEAGEEVSFHGLVTNVGQARGTHRDFVQLQIDQDSNGTWDYSCNNLAIVGGLPVGASQSVQWGTTGVPPAMPWPRVAGTHVMKICLHYPTSTDLEAYRQDANAANDCARLSFTVTGAAQASSSSSSSVQSPSTTVLPNFTISTISMATGPSEGKFSAGIVVKNTGVDWGGATHAILEFHRSGGTAWESIVPAKDIPPLRSGQEAEANWNDQGRGMSGTAPLSSGTYEFRACADAWNLVAESDERNCTSPVIVVIPSAGQSAASSSVASSQNSSAVSSSATSSARSRSSAGARRSASSASYEAAQQADVATCLSSAQLKVRAESFCRDHCNRRTGKCGVKNYRVGAACTNRRGFRSAVWQCHDNVRSSWRNGRGNASSAANTSNNPFKQ